MLCASRLLVRRMPLRCCLLIFWGVPSIAAAATWVDPCEEAPASSSTGTPDHALLQELLSEHVSSGSVTGITSTLVDYSALREDLSKLRAYLGQLCTVDLAALSHAEALALLINAYNAVMLAIIVHYAPKESVLQLHDVVEGGEIWDHKFATLANVKVSLNEIEHGMIRAAGFAERFGAAGRVHAAVNCASLSCPDLQPTAFVAANLDRQLTQATQQWLANPTKNPGPDSSGKIILSQIFQWYGGDFEAEEGSIHDFLRRYSSWEFTDGASLDYIKYDWSLNGINSTGGFNSGAEGLVALSPSLTLATLLLAVFAGIL